MNLTELFCRVDDYIKKYKIFESKKINAAIKKPYSRAFRMSESEIITICILYHQSGYRNFKAFYTEKILQILKSCFPLAVSYNRFVELKSKSIDLFAGFLQSQFGKNTQISYIDSTPIQVCKIKREFRNRVFKDVATKSKSTMGWFFGFKLHLIINENGEILSVKFTAANVDDRVPVLQMTKNIVGKLFADKGYVSKALSNKLLKKGIQLITGLKKKMQNRLLPLIDKILLRKRSVIETVNDQLKNISNIEHSRHRSQKNFIVNLLSGLIAYCVKPKKPSIKGFNKKDLDFLVA